MYGNRGSFGILTLSWYKALINIVAQIDFLGFKLGFTFLTLVKLLNQHTQAMKTVNSNKQYGDETLCSY